MEREVGVAVIGCGYWGPRLIRNLCATPGFRMVAACDLKEGRREFVRRSHPGVEVVADPGELIARSDVQAIWLATPVWTHVPMARTILEAGKHLLVEKPLATSRSEAFALDTLARRRRLALLTGHTFLFSPAVALLSRMMAQGSHGRTRYMTFERINPGPPRTDVSVLWDLAVHDVAILHHLTGQTPIAVSASGLSQRSDGLAEAVFIHLEFEGGMQARLHASWLSSRRTRVATVFGTEATLIYDDLAEDPIRRIGAPRDNRAGAKDGDVIELAYGQGAEELFRPAGPEPLHAECIAFLSAIRREADPPNGIRHALEVVGILEAAERSLGMNGEPVTLGTEHGEPEARTVSTRKAGLAAAGADR